MYLWVISYDITDDKRRNNLAKLLLSYGERVQYSVFECRLKDIADLTDQVNELIDLEQDSVRIYRICDTCREKISLKGQAPDYSSNEHFIII